MTRPRHALHVVGADERRRERYRESARRLMSPGQAILSVLMITGSVTVVLKFGITSLLQPLIAASMVFYGLFVAQKLLLFVASFGVRTPDTGRLPRLDDPGLPVFTILVPSYDEKLETLRALKQYIDRLRYPRHLLQVLPLFEEADEATISAWNQLPYDPVYEKMVLPAGKPQTKPRACNMGFLRAVGEYAVIYDAEDRMDPDQLLKAVAGFRKAPPEVACLQARLFFWNGDTSWVTRMLSIEYIIHFEFVLKGLARLGWIPPLGGTSNFFRTDALRAIAMPPEELRAGGLDPAVMIGAWDALNVTEDAEIAAALVRGGYRIEMIDSFTLEEAPITLGAAVRQRKRWIKGYAQSGLTHTRRPLRSLSEIGLVRWLSYNLLMLGTPVSLIINPVFWGLTTTYFAARFTRLGMLAPAVPVYIEGLFPPAIFYLGVLVAAGGNFLLFYQLVIGCLHRKEYGAVKYMFLAPVWWFFTSVSAWWSLLELVFPRLRFNWGSTVHGVEDPAREAVKIEHYLQEFGRPPTAVGVARVEAA